MMTDQHEAHRSPVRIEPIGEPGRVDPGPPQCQQQQRGLKRAASVEVREEEVGELGDRKHEDEVEEELHGGDLVVALALAAQQSLDVHAARSWFPHHSLARWLVDPIPIDSHPNHLALETGATPRFGYDRRPEKRALWRKAMTLGFPGPLDAAKAASCDTRRISPVMARGGIIGAQHPLVSSTGLRVLATGGNAVDAAVAAALVGDGCHARSLWHWGRSLRHCRPRGSIGSEGNGDLLAFHGSGIAPRGASLEFMREHGEESASGRRVMPQDGPLSPSVPGFIDGCFQLLERFGTRPFAELAAPAHRLCRGGRGCFTGRASGHRGQRRAARSLPGQRRDLPSRRGAAQAR